MASRKAGKALGRSLLRGEATVDEVRELTKGFPTAKEHFKGDPTSWGYDTIVIDGDLDIAGDLDTFARGWCSLVVKGSLRVSGLFSDCDDPATGVFVLGSMEAGRVLTSGSLAVAGTLVVKEALVGDYNEYSARISGNVTTPLFVPEKHYFDIQGTLHAGAVVGYGAEHSVPRGLKKSAKPRPEAEWRELLVPEVLDIYEEDGTLHEVTLLHDVLKKRMREGLPILLPGAPLQKSGPAPRARTRRTTAKGDRGDRM